MNQDIRPEAESTPQQPGSSGLARKTAARELAEPSERELQAQIRLLGDDSPLVLAAVRGKLSHGGPRIERALREAAESSEPRLRMRARDLLAGSRRDAVLRRLTRTVSRPRIELESALFQLGNLATDRFDARPYRRALDAMAERVNEQAAAASDPREAVLALPRYLADELGFTGAEEDYHHPDNIHVFRAIERRTGMPLTLAAIYLFVARRAGIRAAMVALPGHVLLRLYYGRNRSLLIDPFQGGEVRTRADCIAYLRLCDLVPQPEWFRDSNDEAIFLRQLMNLVNSNRLRGHRSRARELRGIAEVLAHVQSHRRPALRD